MSYKLIITVVPQYSGELVTKAARDSGCPGGTVLMGTETSENGIIQLLGFGDAPKDITYNLTDADESEKIIRAICCATAQKKSRFGILFSISVGDFIKAGSDADTQEVCGLNTFVAKERTVIADKQKAQNQGDNDMSNSYQMINVIVNKGYAEDAMAAARKAGAGGGTIIQAHGTAKEGDAKFFGAEIVPEKDMLMILVPSDKKEAIVKAITDLKCFSKAGSGIVFCNEVKDFTVLGKK